MATWELLKTNFDKNLIKFKNQLIEILLNFFFHSAELLVYKMAVSEKRECALEVMSGIGGVLNLCMEGNHNFCSEF